MVLLAFVAMFLLLAPWLIVRRMKGRRDARIEGTRVPQTA
jgi:hypothetical protein